MRTDIEINNIINCIDTLDSTNYSHMLRLCNIIENDTNRHITKISNHVINHANKKIQQIGIERCTLNTDQILSIFNLSESELFNIIFNKNNPFYILNNIAYNKYITEEQRLELVTNNNPMVRYYFTTSHLPYNVLNELTLDKDDQVKEKALYEIKYKQTLEQPATGNPPTVGLIIPWYICDITNSIVKMRQEQKEANKELA